jgi:transcription initiation factor TFIIE subunit alpha
MVNQKISKKLTEDVISEVAGADVLPLIDAIKNQKNVSEFKLAQIIKREVNDTRNMLYRLFNANLVTFIRKKDKIKGWYIYYWTFNPKRVLELEKSLRIKKLEKLRERLSREKSNHFFICKNKCIRLDFEQAIDFEFKCPECNEIMNQEENKDIITQIEKEINTLEKEILKEEKQKK